MAREVRSYAAVIPAGTPVAAPVVIDVSFPEAIVSQVNWRIPPGPAGLMGWQLSMGGVQVIPTGPGVWVVGDDISGQWPLTGQPDSGAWQVTGYNTGIYPHTVYLDFLLDQVGQATAASSSPAAVPAGLAGLTGAVPAT